MTPEQRNGMIAQLARLSPAERKQLLDDAARYAAGPRTAADLARQNREMMDHGRAQQTSERKTR